MSSALLTMKAANNPTQINPTNKKAKMAMKMVTPIGNFGLAGADAPPAVPEAVVGCAGRLPCWAETPEPAPTGVPPKLGVLAAGTAAA